MRAIPVLTVLAALAAAPVAAETAPAGCPPALDGARRLVLVTTPDMSSLRARLRRFERSAPGAAWREVGPSSPAVVGATGLGWPVGATDAPAGEPRKHEGDKRAPAGVFPLGRPFGTAPSALAGYRRLAPGADICVDDPASPDYGRIVSRREDPTSHGEDMGREPLYRRGFVIDVPVEAARRGGSCIFLHVWRAADRGTVGCVAAPEPVVAELQRWATAGDVVAILPDRDAGAVLACLARPGP